MLHCIGLVLTSGSDTEICIIFVSTFSRSNVSDKQGIDQNFRDRSSGVSMRHKSYVSALSFALYAG